MTLSVSSRVFVYDFFFWNTRSIRLIEVCKYTAQSGYARIECYVAYRKKNSENQRYFVSCIMKIVILLVIIFFKWCFVVYHNKNLNFVLCLITIDICWLCIIQMMSNRVSKRCWYSLCAGGVCSQVWHVRSTTSALSTHEIKRRSTHWRIGKRKKCMHSSFRIRCELQYIYYRTEWMT